MKVGDLVELSSYGSNLKMFIHLHDCVGLVKDACYDHYVVDWCGVANRAARSTRHRRKDLKLVK